MGGEQRQTVNLGLIKAIFVGVNPPLNTKILWFDDNSGVKLHKYYDIQTSQWIPLNQGGIINGVYTYIAYATDCEGANFNLELQNNSTHWAIITSNVPVTTASLIPTLFENRWTEYCNDDEPSTNFTYIRYADDCEGTNLDDKPVFEVPCADCNWVDTFNVIDSRGGISLTPVTDGIRIDFNNVISDNFIEIALEDDGNAVPNYLDKYIEILQDDSFTAAQGSPSNIYFDISTDPNTQEELEYQNSPNECTTFIAPINGSKIQITISRKNASAFSGSVTIKIGNLQCDKSLDPNEKCYSCHNFMAIITSQVAIPDADITPDLFEGFWIPITGNDCKDSNGSFNTSISNLNQQIKSIGETSLIEFDKVKLLIQNLQTELDNYKNSNDSEVSNIKDDLNQLQNDLITKETQLQNQIDSLSQSNSDRVQDITNINNTLTATGIMSLIQTNLDSMFSSFKTTQIDPVISNIETDVNDNEGAINNHETRINNLENPA